MAEMVTRRPPRRRAAVLYRRAALALALVALIARAVYAWQRGEWIAGDWGGWISGIAAAGLMAIAAIYGWRRRSSRVSSRFKLGSAAAWLQLHLWGGGLFLFLVALHAGPRLPTGAMGWWLWILAIWVVGTGLFGLLLQRSIPPILAAGTATEVHYDRIPELVEELRTRAADIADAADVPVRTLYAHSLAPALAAPRRNLSVLLDSGGGRRLEPIEHLRRLLGKEERQRLDELEQLYRAKLDLDTHFTLQQLLRGWLWLHVPTSLALVLLVLLHIAAVVYY